MWISIPNFKNAEAISTKTLEKTGLILSTNTGTNIHDLIKRKPKKTSDTSNTSPRSVEYEIPCSGCGKSYVGKTGRGRNKTQRT